MFRKAFLLIVGLAVPHYASALLLVEQYDDFWSTDVNQLINYANTNPASSSIETGVIDFTDDPAGFAGAIPGSSPWPSAAAAGASGTAHPLNETFFVRITGDFAVPTSDTYTFRTFNDDGVFLYIDGMLIIDDPNEHAEEQRTGIKALTAGQHSVELYFFENGGEASLEFTVADSSGNFTQFDDPSLQISAPSSLILLGAGLFGFVSLRHRIRR